MRMGVAVRRFGIPGFVHSLYHLISRRAIVSPRAELEWSSLLEIGRASQISSFVKIKAS